jgi:23S rRNA U2552 (ribose-2'-O)-methylase RlmE/FtsJ
MISFNFNNITHQLRVDDIKLTQSHIKAIHISISHSLYHYLTMSKKKIDNNVADWDFYKKLTNPFEFIHTPPYSNNKAVADYIGVSRSFYKLIEIINYFKLVNTYDTTSINSFHLAEGPGGFIEALLYLRNNKNDKYHGMTLLSDCKNIPTWNKLRQKFTFNTNIIYEDGIKKNGNLLEPENFTYCFNKYKNSMDFMTGDGGFDFSLDYEKQEISSHQLIFAQIAYAMMMQKKNGTFILKIFDIFYKASIDLLYLLNTFYTSVTICKPKTSRFANSEKYIVCTGFLYEDTSQYYESFFEILTSFKKGGERENQFVLSFLKFEIPRFFIQEMEEMNIILGKKQLNTIHHTLQLIQERRTDKVERLRKANIEKCTQWCSINMIPYSSNFKADNVFTKHLAKHNSSVINTI